MVIEEGGASLAGLENLINKVLAGRESEKEQAKKIGAMEKDLRLVKGMICDKDGNCRLPTKQDLVRLAEAQGAKGDLTQYKGQELWNELKGRPSALKDVEGIFLAKLKDEPDYMKRAAEDPQFQAAFLDGICTTPGCREKFNKEVEKYQKAHPERKEHWLTKK